MAAGTALTIPAVAPAQADGGTYSQITYLDFSDQGDAPTGRDLADAGVAIDPNLSELELYADLGAESPNPSFLVLRLGDLVSGECQFRLEVVSNRGDDEPVVRAPGDSTLPPAAPRGRAREQYRLEDDPGFVDLVPTCAVMDVLDPEGAVVDTANATVQNLPVARGLLGIALWPETVLNVDSGAEQVLEFRIAQAVSRVYDVTLDAIASDPGLTVETPHTDLGDWGGRWAPTGASYVYPRLGFTATPGLHTLTLRLAGGNARTAERTVTIWGRGGPALAPRDSLEGSVFIAEEKVRRGSTTQRSRVWTSYAFLDDTWARRSTRDTGVRSAPAPYRPCTRVTRSCLRYTFDARTRAIQIGGDRGEVRDRALRFHRVHDHAARSARAGSTVAFSGHTHFGREDHGGADFWLTLRKDGTFLRQTQVDEFQERPTRQRGTYRIGQDGLLVARTERGTVLRTGLAFLLDEQGRPRPQLLGVYAFDVLFRPRPR